MCGICGIAFDDPSQEVAAETLRRMNRALRYRGPDGEGYFRQDGIGLGHSRLIVIDPQGGVQPMSDPQSRATVVFNGEIYNFHELRRELEAGGVCFRTRSDTEVLLQGYLRWGEGVLDRLAGMFAFAVWDRQDQSLLLARDRFGVKPLYWAQTPAGDLAFGSELSAIVASGLVEPRLNAAAVHRYVALGYVIGEESILDGVRRLPPGQYGRWTRGGGLQRHVYWDMAERWSALAGSRIAGDDTEAFAALLEEATRQRLASDVPLGVLLSGGLDSSMVAALMRRSMSEVRSFSCGFREASYNELPWARRAAEALGTRHHDEMISPDAPELLLEIAARQDEPFADTSIVPTYALAGATRQHVTVALSGDGGDELLAGYVTHLADALHRRMSHLPRLLPRSAAAMLALAPDSRRKVNLLFKAKQFFKATELDEADAHARWRMLADDEAARSLLASGWPAEGASAFAPFRAAYAEAAGLTPLDRMLYVDYRTWLADDILVKVDRASMAHGLEVRSPLLDHRLFEFCARLEPRRKLHRGRGKIILRDAARRLLPRAILRRRKAGFNAPVAHWIGGSWRQVVQEYLGEGRLRRDGVFNPGAVGRLLREHASGRRDHGHLLFALLQLALWMEKVRPALP